MSLFEEKARIKKDLKDNLDEVHPLQKENQSLKATLQSAEASYAKLTAFCADLEALIKKMLECLQHDKPTGTHVV
ncbi:hypothetical protein M5689_003173 [Euphorbia peplus]|nr:hypothetical protein M5689_003173 [Euphorbia peplus]